MRVVNLSSRVSIPMTTSVPPNVTMLFSQASWAAEIKRESCLAQCSRFFNVHCKFLARGQSVHYGRCSGFVFASHTQCLSTISHYDFVSSLPWKHFFSSFSWYSVRESGEESTQRNKKRRKYKKTKVQSKSREWSTIEASHRPITPSSILCWLGDILIEF